MNPACDLIKHHFLLNIVDSAVPHAVISASKLQLCCEHSRSIGCKTEKLTPMVPTSILFAQNKHKTDKHRA